MPFSSVYFQHRPLGDAKKMREALEKAVHTFQGARQTMWIRSYLSCLRNLGKFLAASVIGRNPPHAFLHTCTATFFLCVGFKDHANLLAVTTQERNHYRVDRHPELINRYYRCSSSRHCCAASSRMKSLKCSGPALSAVTAAPLSSSRKPCICFRSFV